MKIVIKVGTQILIDNNSKVLDENISNLVRQIANLRLQGIKLIFVSSGAVGYGRKVSNGILQKTFSSSTAEKQLLASLGQHELMHTYSRLFKEHGLLCSQLLLTKQDFHTKTHYKNIARLLDETMNHHNIVPIVNENDSVSIEELMFTDNDELSGLLATQIDADKLIILTGVDGIYDGNPSDPASKIIPVLTLDSSNINISNLKSSQGRGGMVSKLSTARKMSNLGITTHVCSGTEENVLLRLISGESIGTMITPFKKRSATKRWIAFNYSKNPNIYINKCLFDIITTGKPLSILPVGIERFDGIFNKGDLIDIIAPNGKKMGAGLARYSSSKLEEYMGQKSKPVFIHYDHLYLEVH